MVLRSSSATMWMKGLLQVERKLLSSLWVFPPIFAFPQTRHRTTELCSFLGPIQDLLRPRGHRCSACPTSPFSTNISPFHLSYPSLHSLIHTDILSPCRLTGVDRGPSSPPHTVTGWTGQSWNLHRSPWGCVLFLLGLSGLQDTSLPGGHCDSTLGKVPEDEADPEESVAETLTSLITGTQPPVFSST